MRKFPRWFWIALAVGVVVYAGFVIAGWNDDKPNHEKYETDREFCEARATNEVNASDGLYRVGGRHWVDAVNHCLLERAKD